MITNLVRFLLDGRIRSLCVVVHNTQRPDSTIKKKSNQICYHFIRESVAMNESLVGHIKTNENPADLATKIVTNQPKRQYLTSKLLYDIYDH